MQPAPVADATADFFRDLNDPDQGRRVTTRKYTNHGLSGHPLYGIWDSMLQRCLNPHAFGYPKYGAAGVTVCQRWQGPDGLSNFIADVGERPSLEHTLDRYPDPFGNYEPDNCRWATASEQQRNRTDSVHLTYNGRTQHIIEWAEETGIPILALRHRIRVGWTHERALTTPHEDHSVEFDGRRQTLKEWASEVGVPYGTVWARIKRGWTAARALTTPIGTKGVLTCR